MNIEKFKLSNILHFLSKKMVFRCAFLFLFLSTIVSFSQELNCKVQVVSPTIQGTDKSVFDNLQTTIFEFMNNRKWTNETFKNTERIDCSILVNITERMSTDEFKANIQIQVRRPVFKSSYNTVLLNNNDNDFQFKYLENQTLDYSENVYTSNLTSVLAFYAYFIIGLDYDSFELKGGTPYLQKALAIVNNAQSGNDLGWKAFDGNKNRYWLINNMLDATFVPLRECMYKYHRLGMDLMVDNKETARVTIFESLQNLRKIHQIKPLSYSMQVFFYAKSDEIINIFSGAFPDEKAKIVNLLNEIDPTNSNKYQKILASK
jgi:hypothetical protein